ncbi:anthranilate synthase component I [Pseudobacteroides cellulosolvens]|uniref:Anthranilate synthase component 1 n=1 Tax=Pseudobacteroides cellulosolvens ATCC 35603 = DSM 2933 TaxID=398512 RepID=A0A0L6JHT6_9FIRM|nr:anthranilate synthase component I [Pseudobacteroides cellulosolvens]KNY25279.1 anthranilate synthase component I [Pseudobacteroides cellulosolvens ATCC 35603 = DSM 2933]
MFYPELSKAVKLSKEYNIIPVIMEVYADMETPISLFKRFEDSQYCFLLESVEGGEKWARYSFIGRNPFLIVKSRNGRNYIEDRNGNKTIEDGNPIEVIKALMGKYRGADIPKLPRFNGGAVGFFGYDLIRYYENLPNIPEDDLDLPESHFMFTDEVIVFDHLKQKIHIIVNMHVNGNIERAYNSTTERIKAIYKEILSSRWKINENIKPELSTSNKEFNFTSNISREKFCENVVRAKQYIKDGDIFQVVLSQRLCVETDHEPLDIYRVLRVLNPSPYMYYLKLDDYRIIGSSPEMLVRVEDGVAETCPIAGTRKRGSTKEEDEALEKELLADKKECAEHTMLVDLGRNDIGKVSKYGTVKVNNLMHIERYSHVMHIVTNVVGELNEDKTPFDALMSVLPAGTVSGAPKVRAMEIIDELENVKRGPYAGAIGYLSFNSNLDSCITIRTMVIKDNKAYIQAGAGIVADSVPEMEYEETLNKAKALLKALEEVGGIR